MPGPVLALFGPTGVGKTDVALAVADRLRARGERPVAVGADALQVYRGLRILTGAPAPEEEARLEHRLVGFVPVDRNFSAGEYAALARAEIDALLADGSRPLVVGGTGLYLRAALADLDLRPPPVRGDRERWSEAARRSGPATLHAALAAAAPWAAERIDPQDRHRLVRALELLDQGALAPRPGENRLWTRDTRHPTRLVGLVMERRALHERIGARVEAMVAAGAVEEVRGADQAGASPTARAALGFAELLAGGTDEAKLRSCVEAMKTRTRRYARRQLTWMRKLPDVELVDVTTTSPEDVAAQLV